MFWTDIGIRGKMERADLTGENRLTLRYLYYQRIPISFVIDFKAERIYWMDRYNLFYTDRNGYSRNYLRGYFSQNINPVDLALYEDNLYWVDTNSRSIHWFNKTQPRQMLSFGHLTNGILVGAVVLDESRQPASKYYRIVASIEATEAVYITCSAYSKCYSNLVKTFSWEKFSRIDSNIFLICEER